LVDGGVRSARTAGGGISVVLEGALTAYFGLSDEYCDLADSFALTGRGGSSASPQAGALTLLADSLDLVLDTVTIFVPFEYVDPPEAAEEFDSTESLLMSCLEGRREGRDGGGRDGCRVGSGGGGGLACLALFPVGDMIFGGGRSPLYLRPFG
jgi:hypothetical protein